MTDEDVLSRVRDHVKDDRKDDAAAEAIARGDTDAAEAKALAKRAEEGDADAKALLEASAPLGKEAEDRIVAKLVKKPASASASASASAPAKVSFLRRVVTYGGPIALAACIVLYVVSRPATGGGPSLPDYGLTATGEQAMRGDTVATTHLKAGSDTAKFEIVARPAVHAGTRVAAWAFVMGEGEPNPLDAKIEIAPEGSVRITGTGRALREGREIRVVIAPAETIAKYDEALSRAKVAQSDAHVRVLVVAIDPASAAGGASSRSD